MICSRCRLWLVSIRRWILSCLLYQHWDVKVIEKNFFEKSFSNFSYSLNNNKLSVYFDENKTKNVLFDTKRRLKKPAIWILDMARYILNSTIHIITYLGYVLDQNLLGEPMALQVIWKINTILILLYRKNIIKYINIKYNKHIQGFI